MPLRKGFFPVFPKNAALFHSAIMVQYGSELIVDEVSYIMSQSTQQIGQGRTANIWQYREGQILKLYYANMPEEEVRREFTVSQMACKMGLPTPQAVELVEKDGRIGIVFERLQGPTLLKLVLKQIWRIDRHARLLAKLHYQLHQTPLPEPAPVLRTMKNTLQWQMQRARHLSQEEKLQVEQYLSALPDGEPRLCHGDFHPDNVMIQGDTAYYIDWMTGTLGNPAADAARTVLLLRMGTMPDGTPKLVDYIVGKIRRRLERVYHAHYLRLSGLTAEEVERWFLPLAAARLSEGIPEAEKVLLAKLVREKLGRV